MLARTGTVTPILKAVLPDAPIVATHQELKEAIDNSPKGSTIILDENAANKITPEIIEIIPPPKEMIERYKEADKPKNQAEAIKKIIDNVIVQNKPVLDALANENETRRAEIQKACSHNFSGTPETDYLVCVYCGKVKPKEEPKVD
jgi:hypothetical protein